MKNKIKIYICHGFSHFFLPIRMDLFRVSKFRTALILKNSSCCEDFLSYIDFIKSFIEFIANKFNDRIEVSFSGNKYIAVESCDKLINLISSNASKKNAQRTYKSIKFKFIKGKNVEFLLSIEDWTDIDLIEFYSSSCVLSFYSCDKNTNNKIGEHISEFIKFNSNNVKLLKSIDEFKHPQLFWFFFNKMWRSKRVRGNNIREFLSKNNQIELIVFNGFNKKNKLPVKIKNRPLRIGFILKKQNFTDGIDLYKDLIFNTIFNVNKALSSNCFISTKEVVKNLKKVSDWDEYLNMDKAKNQEFDTYYPIRIFFEKNGNIIAETIFEDWSAIECDNSDVYRESYTLSFYTSKASVTNIIYKVIINETRKNSIVGLISEITEELSPKWYWRYIHKVLNQNYMYKMRRHSRLSKIEKIETYICKGFNCYCSAPKLKDFRKQIFRTALIIKKEDFFDCWEITYNNIFWELINNLVANMTVDLEIVEIDNSSLYVPFDSWENTFKAKTNISGDELDEPTELRMIKGNKIICVISLENWSDSPSPHPYNWSYTYSFYTNNAQIDKTIYEILSSSIKTIPSVELIDTIQEYHKPIWYLKYKEFLESIKEWVLIFLITALLFFIWHWLT